MPTYDPMASLYLENGQWVLHHAFACDSAEPRPANETEELPLSADTINRVLNSIADHAVPSV